MKELHLYVWCKPCSRQTISAYQLWSHSIPVMKFSLYGVIFNMSIRVSVKVIRIPYLFFLKRVWSAWSSQSRTLCNFNTPVFRHQGGWDMYFCGLIIAYSLRPTQQICIPVTQKITHLSLVLNRLMEYQMYKLLQIACQVQSVWPRTWNVFKSFLKIESIVLYNLCRNHRYE